MIPITDDANAGGNANIRTTSRKDVILFFCCGLLADALPGLFFTPTVLKMLTPDGNPVVLSLSASVGAVIGVLFSSFVLTKLQPEIRVAVNATLQAVGILISWLAGYPTNIIAGISILTIGFAGMLATIMPLSSFAGVLATKSYQL